jgi:hypothetical protein
VFFVGRKRPAALSTREQKARLLLAQRPTHRLFPPAGNSGRHKKGVRPVFGRSAISSNALAQGGGAFAREKQASSNS